MLQYSSGDQKYVWRVDIISNKPAGLEGRTIEKAFKEMEENDKSIDSVLGRELGKTGSGAKRIYYFINESEESS